MANRVPMRRSDTTGQAFGLLMLVIVFIIVLLMWYFQGNQDSNPLPQRPPGIQRPL
jgi:hypothetical protein